MKNAIATALLLGCAALPAHAQTTVTAGYSEGASDDLFQGAIVDATSPILGGFSAADAFGAVTSSGPYEESMAGGHVIFADGETAPFIDFHTAAAVTIAGFDLFLSGDGVGNPFRGFSAVRLFASEDGGATFGTLLGGASYDPAAGAVRVSALFDPRSAQYFRFSGDAFNGGARVLEIDGRPAVPEPASWAMMLLGFGGLGYAIRRRPAPGPRIRFA